jgi:hypothetical protein
MDPATLAAIVQQGGSLLSQAFGFFSMQADAKAKKAAAEEAFHYII